MPKSVVKTVPSINGKMIDATYMSKDDQLSMIFLDWAKAFDRVSPPAMLAALRSFGIPQHYADVIGDIYTERTFMP